MEARAISQQASGIDGAMAVRRVARRGLTLDSMGDAHLPAGEDASVEVVRDDEPEKQE